MSDASNINIEIKPINSYQIKSNNILESKLNTIKKNIEDVNFNKDFSNNKNSNNNSEFFEENNNTNLIAEINEDDEEKNENNDMNNRTVPISSNHLKYNISKDMGYSQYINNTNRKDDYYNNDINKDFQFGENEEYFKNRIEKESKEEDDIQLSGIINKGDEFDTIDKYTISERSLLSQIGSGKKDMFSNGKKIVQKKD